MPDDDRLNAVRAALFDYVKSPSLKHIRDPYFLNKLALELLSTVDRRSSAWLKWEGGREALVKAAVGCWAPIEDLRDHLNRMEGPRLTTTDVAERLRAFEEEDYSTYPNEDLKESCLALYECEKTAGTELPAIIGALQEHVRLGEERLRDEQQARWRAAQEAERVALEQRFLSGADCKWTPLDKSAELYCRLNGRTYRLSPTKDKKWLLERIERPADQRGLEIGRYKYRRDVTKVLAQIAYASEPHSR